MKYLNDTQCLYLTRNTWEYQRAPAHTTVNMCINRFNIPLGKAITEC